MNYNGKYLFQICMPRGSDIYWYYKGNIYHQKNLPNKTINIIILVVVFLCTPLFELVNYLNVIGEKLLLSNPLLKIIFLILMIITYFIMTIVSNKVITPYNIRKSEQISLPSDINFKKELKNTYKFIFLYYSFFWGSFIISLILAWYLDWLGFFLLAFLMSTGIGLFGNVSMVMYHRIKYQKEQIKKQEKSL